jgi:cob(I)alamin adenosyltransferase
MKIYTRTGDDGSTGLLGPGRVPKHAGRVEAYGSVDELNAVLGRVQAHDTGNWLSAELSTIQSKLFHLGAELAASTPEALGGMERISDEDVAALERWIDRLDAELPPLAKFVLPGGSGLGAELHVARTVCRRAERRIVALAQAEALELRLVRYVNRLADLLFVMARWCNRRAGAAETEWRTGRS